MQSKDPSMSRKSSEQKLAELALRIADYSNEDAANALLALSSEFRFLGLEAQMMAPYEQAANDLKSKLEARLRALEAEAKKAPEMPTPAPAPSPVDPPPATPAAPVANETVVEPAPEPETTVEPEIIPEPEAKEPEVPTLAFDGVEQNEAPAPAEPVAPAMPATPAAATEKKSLNDRLAGGVLKFGLNDRIGFVKDLFDGSQEDFNRVVSQLNTLGSFEEANEFIQTHIAGEYRWEEKEETAARFMAAVEQKFG
jgi:hypothetical protein